MSAVRGLGRAGATGLHFALGILSGAMIGLMAAGVVLSVSQRDAAAAVQLPFYLMGATNSSSCEDWASDSSLWKDVTGDGVKEPFSYWWSGKPRFWNLPSAHGCWHNDENTPTGDVSRPGVDLPGAVGTDVLFRTDHWNSFTAWPGVLFQSTGCAGVEARVFSPAGLFLTTVRFWHATPVAGVIGTNWTYHVDVPGYGTAYRQVGDVVWNAANNTDGAGCTTYGPHAHQSVWQGTTSTNPLADSLPNKQGNPAVVVAWLRWGTY